MIAVIGVGAMGGALTTGWIAVGTSLDEIVAVDQDTDRLTRLWERRGVHSVGVPGVSVAEVAAVAVKPHRVATALTDIAPYLGPKVVVVSVVVGVILVRLTEVLSEGQPVIWVMSNTSALVGRGVVDLVAGPTVIPEQIARVVAMVEAVGICVELPESRLDVLTAISGSGLAYPFLIAKAMIEVGVHQGLGRDAATRLVNGTFAGTAAMLEEANASVTELRERAIFPAGTMAAALRVLDERAVWAAFLAAVGACACRSSEF